MNTKKAVTEKLIAMILVFVLTISNFGIVGEEVFAYIAEAVVTNNDNVEIIAYFEDEEGNQLNESDCTIGETLILKVQVTVKNNDGLGGYFEGTINVNGNNFDLVDSSEISVYVNAEDSELIEKEIEYKYADSVTSDYLSQESTITLTGTYTNSKKEYEIEGETSVKVNWKTPEEESAVLASTVITNKDYTIGEESKRLVQIFIGSKLSDNKELADTTEITVTVPEGVEEIEVHRRTVNTNSVETTESAQDEEAGEDEQEITEEDAENAEESNEVVVNTEGITDDLTYSYDSESKILTINSVNNGSQDILVVTYKLAEGTEIEDEIKIENTITAYDGAQRSAETTVEIEDEKDGVITTSITEDEESIYKGKLYTGEDRTYNTTTKINIDSVETSSSIDIKENAVKYVSTTENEDGEEETEEKSANITYVKTTINKNNFLNLFEETGYVTIKDQDGNVIANITNESETNDDGDIEITYTENSVTSIEIVTSEPQDEGVLRLNHEKKITEDSYSRDEIEDFTAIKESNKTINEDGKTVNTEKEEIELKETESVATISLEESTVYTTEDDQELVIRATLDTSDESKDLYKNPTIEITLPEEITSIEVVQSKALYRNGLTIKSCNIAQNDNYVLSIEFEGEQETYDTNGGVEVYIKLAIEIDITTPTHTDEIEMTYTNDNKDVEKETSTNIKFKSKYGLMIYDQIYNYNEAGDDVEVINDEETTIELDKDAESKELEIRTYLINNHNKEIENVVYIGTIPSENDNNTFTATLNSVKTNNEDVKIYYSTNIDATEDDESWTEDITDAVAYKLVVDKMESQETIKVSTKISIPENLGTNQEGEITQSVSYLYNEAEQTRSATIGLMTEYEIVLATTSLAASLENGITTEVAEGLDVTIYAVSANEELSDGDSIYEGQTVKYYITIEDNTGEDLSNVSVSATQTNGKVWGIDVRSEWNAQYGEYVDCEYYDKLDTSELEIDTIESLASGESITLEYEAYANELENCDGTSMHGTITITSENESVNTSVNTISSEIQEAELILEIRQTSPKNNSNYTLHSDSVLLSQMSITNVSSETLTDISIQIFFSNTLDIEGGDIFYDEEIISISSTDTDSDGNTVMNVDISNIEANETLTITLYPSTIDIDVGIESEIVTIYAQATVNEKTYYSNVLTDIAYQLKNDIEISQTVTVNGEEFTEDTVVEDGDTVTFIINITNNESESISLSIEDYFENGVDAESASTIMNDETTDITEYLYMGNYLYYGQSVSAETAVRIEITAIIDVNSLNDSSFSNTLSAIDQESGITYNTTVTLTANKTVEDDIEETNEEETDNSSESNSSSDNATSDDNSDGTNNNDKDSDSSNNNSTDTNSDENTTSDDSYYSISGTVWLDENEDGQRDSSEGGISGITVRVIDVSSGEVIDTSTSTGSDGTYSLSLEEGTYIIVFLYDSSTYSITTYQASGVSDDANSDAIKDNVEIDGETQTVATTDNISLTSDTTNIDLGLIENSEANLSIAKYVTQIIVENSTGTKTYTQDDEETLAKVEIGSKVISGSNVTVEYVIEITNSGEQSGDIGTIVDYLPSELSFSTSSNSGWYESGDYIYNDSLENEEIDPGETKEVTLILTKTMTDSNTGLINNKTGLLSSDGETEISTASADIMIGIKTGTIITYISLIIIILLVILIAIYVINEKHILEKMFSR